MLEQTFKNQVGAALTKLRSNASTTLLIGDAQSVKNTDTVALKGYGAGKKASGIMRHIVIDIQGFSQAVAATVQIAKRSIAWLEKKWRLYKNGEC